MKKSLLAISGALALCGTAQAQTTYGYASIVEVPVVVNTSTFTTDLYVHNSGGASVTYSVSYYGATGTPTGSKSCGTITLAGSETGRYDLGSLCGLSGAQSNFGRLRIYELATTNVPFSAYARIQSFSGNGFSVEGFPAGQITGTGGGSGNMTVQGLRRQAAAPGYQTNCFFAALNEPTSITWQLRNGTTGAAIGSSSDVPLNANQMVRVLDIFAAAGAPAGDYSNVRLEAYENHVDEAGILTFCTVQNNTSFDADFRIAKDRTPGDLNHRYSVASGTDGLGNALSLTSYGSQDIHGIHLRNPDWVSCSVGGANTANLEMRLKRPDGTVVAGGSDTTSFGEVYIGERDAVVGGVNGLWTIEVGTRGTGTLPLSYSISCTNGNGTHRPLKLGTSVDNF